jgi:hypothetical protein
MMSVTCLLKAIFTVVLVLLNSIWYSIEVAAFQEFVFYEILRPPAFRLWVALVCSRRIFFSLAQQGGNG